MSSSYINLRSSLGGARGSEMRADSLNSNRIQLLGIVAGVKDMSAPEWWRVGNGGEFWDLRGEDGGRNNRNGSAR
jgi:hypothetical protein